MSTKIETQPRHKAVLISMQTTPKQNNLPGAKTEVTKLDEVFRKAKIDAKVLHQPSKQEVLKVLPGCTIFHFAGHGESDAMDPSKSKLLLTDWQSDPLTVGDLTATQLHHEPPLLAYLSACSTAKNEVDQLLDEGIHLAGACQLAGFQHVVGSLWEVSDQFKYSSLATPDGLMSAHFATFRFSFAICAFASVDRSKVLPPGNVSHVITHSPGWLREV